jgi:hypothetical protein
MMVANQPSAGAQIIQAEEEAMAAQQQQMGGAPMPSPTGAPMPPAAMPQGQSATLDELIAQADQIAQQLFIADPLQRDRELSQLKNSDEALYAQVKARLDSLRQQAQQQGVQLAQAGQIPIQ